MFVIPAGFAQLQVCSYDHKTTLAVEYDFTYQ